MPPEILARGPSALKAYNKALKDGETSVRRVPIMLIGQDRAGKTSLKKSLKGICFNPEEDSTVGIDVDPSHFKVTTETWRTGTTDNDQDSNEAISFDYLTARWIADSLKEKSENTPFEVSTVESESTFDSEITELAREPSPTEPSRDIEQIQSTSDLKPTVRSDFTHSSILPIEQKNEDVNRPTAHLPEEVAAVTETLLRGDWEDEREDVYSTLWDFAGQSVYYVTHPLFLTVRAIYCLVYDLSLNPHGIAKPLVKQGVYKKTVESYNLKTNLDYLDFWMMSVGSLASSHYESSDIGPESEVLPAKIPPVFLVCTHADSPYDDRDPKELAFEILGWLKSKPCGAQLSGVFVVDNTKSGTESECSGVTHLRQEILNAAKALPHINEAIPIKWLKFDKILNALKENGRRYISLESAKDIASKICNIDEDKEFQTLMNYLHDLRSLIHFDDSLELNKLVVLDPQWLIDVFKKVITVQPAYNCTETNFVKLWEKLEREGILDGTLLDHVWGRLFSSKETFESLVAILENFSLLCPLPSDSVNKQTNYLVPSMLKTHPPKKVFELVKSVKIPSMFIKFETGQVPAGLFPRFVMQFFQWGKESFLRPGQPQLFQSFARFFTSEHEGCSVIFVCHTSSIEVAVHTGNPSLQLAEDFSSKMTLQTHIPCDSPGSSCARVVRRQLGLMLECMRSEFHWLRNMKYYMSFLCPVCCNGGAMDYCLSHNVQGCKDEHCLHFWSESKLCNVKQTITCNNSAFAQNTRVPVLQFAYWSVPAEQQVRSLILHFISPTQSRRARY